ncbi:transposase [Microbulbifer sp. 2304DJ12-6]|uniref:transposase n=1 Tax=Microbulbifer sp. 2304DJ12-6 TaxID=3233340 RepID=UPI0039B023B0
MSGKVDQWQLLVSALAWVLLEYLRDHQHNTKLAKASVATLRNRLIKIAAVVIKSTRRLRFLLPTATPDRESSARWYLVWCRHSQKVCYSRYRKQWGKG